ncbi:MAG: hypothetical protein Q9213_002921 [Squamulea squamosa]
MDSPALGKLNTTATRLSTPVSAATSGLYKASVSALAVAPNASVPTTWMGQARQAVVATARLLPAVLLWIITFTTITLPTVLFTLFSTSLTFTMNATTLLLIVLAFASTITWIVRYRYLTMYTRLPPEPQRKEPQIDLFPDTQEGYSKPGLANYLDEFLSAIKVFGYLERSVFHELTRTMQTRKLIAGETLLLEEEKGFCLVVDGMVQIFVKSGRETTAPKPETWINGSAGENEEGRPEGEHQGYQLLTEVKNGAPMSSLFSVLSLFTEDVKLRHHAEDTGLVSRTSATSMAAFAPQSGPASPDALMDSPMQEPSTCGYRSSTMNFDNRLPTVPPLFLDPATEPPRSQPSYSKQSRPRKPSKRKSVHPDIVARATVDTTIAIIPATAFHRLTRVYPKATAHIVQVILTRLQRVTLATAHAYLGLTTEVLRTEQDMSKYTSYDLPNHLRGSAIERLKDKFTKERERLESLEEGMKGIALHNPRAVPRRRSSSLRKDIAIQARQMAARSNSSLNALDSAIADSKSGVSPGDLVTNLQMSQFAARHPGHPRMSKSISERDAFSPAEAIEMTSPLGEVEFKPIVPSPVPAGMQIRRQDSLDEDAMFRSSILECIIKAIGLTGIKDAIRRPSSSVEQSPRMTSFDAQKGKATFSNAFGFIDPYEGSGDGDSESLHSASGISLGPSYSTQGIVTESRDELEIVYFPRDAVLVEQGERNPGLYYVIDGFLDASIPGDEQDITDLTTMNGPAHQAAEDLLPPLTRASSRTSSARGGSRSGKKRTRARKSLFLIKPGGLAGYVGTISSFRSFVDVRAKTDVYVGFLPRASLERLVEKFPVVLLTMAKRLTSLLPRLILHIDFALEWVQIDAGQVIHHQDDESDAIYIVLNGRLRALLEKGNGQMRVVGEYGQGESVGELEVMTESRRPATLHAIRDTEVAKFPKSLFNSLALEHPGITIKISKIIAQRMRALIEDPFFEQNKEGVNAASTKNVTSTMNLRTTAILPVTAGVPVVEFGSRLLTALTQIGVVNGVTSLNQAAILNHLGRHAFSRMGKLKLSQYLADLEERYGMLLYIADTNVNSPWTQTCISQADCILLVGLAEGSPSMGEYERFLLGMKTTARKELVLLHVDRYSTPGLTRKWLRNRLWINGGHHHIQMAFRTHTEPAHPQIKRFGTVLKQRVQVLQAEIQKYTSKRIRQTPLYSADTPFKGDFHRLARRLCGKSVGLVLGGGGARGISQIGVIRALEEAGIPIDIIGGTSIGAFIGALYARDADVVPMYGRAKKFAGRMGSMWRFALDLTYPSSSYTTGHEFNRGIFKTFGDSQIEDFWLDFYCNTTNISKSRSEIHNSGYVWRYVRASMSLAGLIPPLCDEGSMLLDGGYVDNLTVSHMKSLGAETIFAVDVGSLYDDMPQAFGDSLSGMWALVNRWNPFSTFPNPPTLSEIQARLAYVSSVDALERAKTTPGCLYMRPPIDPYGTLDFGKFDEIYKVGYEYGKEYLSRLRDKGLLPVMEETEEKRNLRRTMAPRRASRKVFVGTFIHTPDLSPPVLTVLENAVIGVDEHGVIVFIHENVAELYGENEDEEFGGGLRRVLEISGWNTEEMVDIVASGKDGLGWWFPGFVDTHTHASQLPNAGLFGTSTLLDWLTTYTFPLESRFSSLSHARRVYNRAVTSTLAHGTTTAAYYATIHPASTKLLADICLEKGQRAFVGNVCMNCKDTCPDYYREESAEESLENTKAVVKHIRAKDPKGEMLQPIVTPRFAPSCTKPLLSALGKLVQDEDLPIQTHISENRGEVALVKKMFPECDSYAGVYDQYGLLTSRTVLAHGIYLSDEELKLISSKRCGISQCPLSNTSLGSGICPVRRVLDRGVKVGLGTDVSGGGSCSILTAAREASGVSRLLAASVQGKGGSGKEVERTKLGVVECLFLATRGGAECLGLEKKVAAFEVGMEFDAQLVRLERVPDEGEGENNSEERRREDKGLVQCWGNESWEEKVAKWMYCGDDRNTKKVYVKGRLVHER